MVTLDRIGTYETELATLTWEQIAKHLAKLAEEPGLLPPATRKRAVRSLAYRLQQLSVEPGFMEATRGIKST